MSDFALYIFTGLAMAIVIEGLCYAIFPEGMRRMMAYALTITPAQFRQMGMIMAAFGVMIVWGLRMISQ